MADLDKLLEESSRTFALTIPLLPEPTRREVTVAYLLLRIADTLEDAEGWSGEHKRDELLRFGALLRHRSREGIEAMLRRLDAEPPTRHPGYLDLLRETPAVFAELDALCEAQREQVVRFTLETVEGMAEVVASDEEGRLALRTLEDLRRYCYVVAGLVGEMLTELMLLDAPILAPAAPSLRQSARVFGEGLQLTNILKDSEADAGEGRVFLPPDVPRNEVFELARADLVEAARYVATLQRAKAPEGFLAFTALPVKLAFATLDAVERLGPGSKIGRAQVARAMVDLQGALARAEPLVPEAGLPPVA
ncbi:MAG: squalene/phytoene synthase family protein [Myxococcales bacterium]|jgi:farnesyl-diphosphate farnesyltransferase